LASANRQKTVGIQRPPVKHGDFVALIVELTQNK